MNEKAGRRYDHTHNGMVEHAEECVKLANERSRYKHAIEIILTQHLEYDAGLAEKIIGAAKQADFNLFNHLLKEKGD